MLQGSAFIGISLDSDRFSRAWLRQALAHVLGRHENLTLLLADRLLGYNKTVDCSAVPYRLDLVAASHKITQRSRDMRKFVESEIRRLNPMDSARIRIASWDDYSDALYTNLFRTLNIAYLSIQKFRCCVDRDAEMHFTSARRLVDPNLAKALSVAYILDETAMDIRVTEMDGHSHDYYPVQQIDTLRCIYEREFASEGLTVDALTGLPPSRVFATIEIPVQVSA